MDLVGHVDALCEGRISVPKQPFTNKAEALALAEKALPSFIRTMKRACPKDGKIKYGIKPAESIDNKLARWKSKGRDITTMFDVLRGMIIVADEEEAVEVVDELSRGPVVAKAEHKDHPQDQFGYYGSHHLDLYLPAFKMVAEVQVMTRRLKAAKNVAHKIYAQHRLDPDGMPPDVAARSRELYRLGNRPMVRQKERRRPAPPVDLEDY